MSKNLLTLEINQRKIVTNLPHGISFEELMNNREIIHEANRLPGFNSEYDTFTNGDKSNVPSGYVTFRCEDHGEFTCIVPEIFFKATVWLQFDPKYAASNGIRENIRYPLIYVPEKMLLTMGHLPIARRNGKVDKEFRRVRVRADSRQYGVEKAKLHFIFQKSLELRRKIDRNTFIKRATIIV